MFVYTVQDVIGGALLLLLLFLGICWWITDTFTSWREKRKPKAEE